MAPENQIHDFNPGIAPSGLFWTVRVPDHSVSIDLEDARATLQISDRDVEDYHDIVNSLQDGPSKPAEVSFHMAWHGVKQRVTVRDTTNRFTGRYIEDFATIAWSAREAGFHFVSDPCHTSITEFAEIGRERNGVFFHPD